MKEYYKQFWAINRISILTFVELWITPITVFTLEYTFSRTFHALINTKWWLHERYCNFRKTCVAFLLFVMLLSVVQIFQKCTKNWWLIQSFLCVVVKERSKQSWLLSAERPASSTKQTLAETYIESQTKLQFLAHSEISWEWEIFPIQYCTGQTALVVPHLTCVPGAQSEPSIGLKADKIRKIRPHHRQTFLKRQSKRPGLTIYSTEGACFIYFFIFLEKHHNR